jgi:transcriptional regulator
MRHNPKHAVTDEAIVRELIAENPWATIVSQHDGEIVASHYPILLDDTRAQLAIVTHVGRPDERIHGFGSGHEVLLIVAGPHGYISPSWYAPGAVRAPTWNFSVAHCYGVPEVLSLEENKATLAKLVAHFEDHVASPVYLEQETADKLAPGTVGIRLEITRFVCKVKMSQDKDEQSQRNVLAELRGDGPYAHPALAAAMERALRR